jgi:hypothetical protein
MSPPPASECERDSVSRARTMNALKIVVLGLLVALVGIATLLMCAALFPFAMLMGWWKRRANT